MSSRWSVSDLAPPERPSYAWPVTFVTACALALGFVCLLAWLDGCATVPPPDVEAQIAAYEAESIACVESSATPAQSMYCRCLVRVKYGRPCYPHLDDAGVPR